MSWAAVSKVTIDISATCGGIAKDEAGNRVTCSWDRAYGTNRQIRAAARRHAISTGHHVSVEECTDTGYMRGSR